VHSYHGTIYFGRGNDGKWKILKGSCFVCDVGSSRCFLTPLLVLQVCLGDDKQIQMNWEPELGLVNAEQSSVCLRSGQITETLHMQMWMVIKRQGN
jgi:hypothetical protein